jgi:magnesium transporter
LPTNNESEKIKVKDVIQIDSELLNNISELIEQESANEISKIVADLHSADIAEIINHLNLDEAKYLFELLRTEVAGEVVVEIDENLREKILKDIDAKKITDIIGELETDDATDIVSDLPHKVAEHVLENINLEDSVEVKELLKYPEDSAGGIMSSDFVFVNEHSTVKTAIDTVRKHAEEFEHIYYIYVINTKEELKGLVTLKSLLLNPLDSKISSIMEDELIYVTPEMDQEEVANIMQKYDLVAVPVTGESRKLIGRITIDDVVDVIQEEADEDIQKIAGLSKEQESSDSVFRISRIRLPWLIIALVMELIAAAVLSHYEANIQKSIVVMFFIPVVLAMGGNSGTQAAIVMVRGLSGGEIWLKESSRKLIKEFFVALLNGLSCSIILLLASYILFDGTTLYLSFLLSMALLIVIIFATMVGSSIPLVLKKFGVDPAIATGPFVTTTNDILGLVIYLAIISIFYIP